MYIEDYGTKHPIWREYILYSDIKTKETKFELWGSSTKHPDSLFFYSNFNPSKYMGLAENTYTWIIECAIQFISFHTVKDIISWANEIMKGY